jgi:8-oxo-dGTP diphosphatase
MALLSPVGDTLQTTGRTSTNRFRAARKARSTGHVDILHESLAGAIVKEDKMGAKEQGADALDGRWIVIPRTLCFVLNGDDVLMMKRGPNRRIFPNRYNGVGGHVERDEDILTSARREILEETGLHVRDVQLRAVYNVNAGQPSGIAVFVFTAWSDSRDFVANVEGTLHWMNRDGLLSLELVDDLPTLLPRILDLPTGAPPLFIYLSYDEQDQVQVRIADDAGQAT